VPRFQIEEFSMMVNLPDPIWVNISVVFYILDDGIVAPRAFPQFVENSQIFIGLCISLIMLNGTIEAYGFECGLFP
jgi:hypothetical protein